MNLEQTDLEKLDILAKRDGVSREELIKKWIDEKTREICVYEYGDECLALTDRECKGCRFFKSKVEYFFDVHSMEVRKK